MKRFVLGCLFALFHSASYAAEPALDRGVQDLALGGSPDFLGPSGDTLIVDAGYGVFIRDRLLLRGTLDFATVEDIAAGDNDYRMREVGVAAEYHFMQRGSFVPYVGLGLGFRSSKFSFPDPSLPADTSVAGSTVTESGVTFGPRVGLKYFVADNIAIDIAFDYRISGKDVFISDLEARNDYFSLNFGLRAMLR